MANPETAVQKNIFALSGLATLFRNNIGSYARPDGAGRVAYGVTPPGGGGSDLIGWVSKVITPNMVGQRVAIFTAIEVKSETGRTDPKRLAAQEHFIQVVADAGGLAGFARSKEDAWDIIAC